MNSEITNPDGVDVTSAPPETQREKFSNISEDWDRISTPESLEATKEEFAQLLEETGLNEDDKFVLNLGFLEGVTNAMKHGNKFSGDHVNISIRITPEKASLTVQDQGEGFDPDAVPDPTSPKRILIPSGRGVFLMKEKFETEYSDRGRKLTLTKKLKAEKPNAGT